MSIEIRLSGDAAAQAQGLAVELLAAGIQVTPADAEDRNRDLTEILRDYSVALVAEATYGLVRDLVHAWLRKRGLNPTDAEITAAAPDAAASPADAPPADTPSAAPEERSA